MLAAELPHMPRGEEFEHALARLRGAAAVADLAAEDAARIEDTVLRQSARSLHAGSDGPARETSSAPVEKGNLLVDSVLTPVVTRILAQQYETYTRACRIRQRAERYPDHDRKPGDMDPATKRRVMKVKEDTTRTAILGTLAAVVQTLAMDIGSREVDEAQEIVDGHAEVGSDADTLIEALHHYLTTMLIHHRDEQDQ